MAERAAWSIRTRFDKNSTANARRARRENAKQTKSSNCFACVLRALRAFAVDTRLLCPRWKNSARHFTKSHAISFALAPPAHRDSIEVLNARAGLALADVDGFGAFPCEFEHAAVAVGRGAADRAAGEQVAGL